MPPLAGRPPYATNKPDSYYVSAPRQQQNGPRRQPSSRNNRSSAYDVYDNYLEPGKDGSNRNSGVGAVGLGFLNGSMDDDDSDDEDSGRRPMDPHHAPVSIPVPQSAPSSKHAALAAATGISKSPSPPPPAYVAAQPRQAAIAAPRPGYAAPISNLNNAAAAGPRSGPGAGPRQPPPGNIPIPSPTNQYGPTSPSPTSPHPLQAPITPIQPVFARPRPPKQDVKFHSDIMRGDKEETLIARRGERGDDFWRRFSIVLKTENTKREKTSGWLKKNQQGTSSFSRWVWIVGIILIVSAAGGIGIGWYLSHKAPDHQQPTAIGGSANEHGAATASATGTLKAVGSGGASALSSLHVSPTNTVARREPETTDLPLALREPEPAENVVHVVPEYPSWMTGEKRDVKARHRNFGRAH